MKTLFCMGFILLLTTPLYAETYSWVDDSGTYNYTEDYSKVPKKYQKKVKRREDIQQDVKQPVSPALNTKPGQTDKGDAKPSVAPADEKKLYGGKSWDAWRREMDTQEAELKRIEQHMEQLRKQANESRGFSKAQYDALKKEYDDNRSDYDQKYKNYNELIETVRKAGINVEIKK